MVVPCLERLHRWCEGKNELPQMCCMDEPPPNCHLDRSMMVLSSCGVERPAGCRARCECLWRALCQDLQVARISNSAGTSKLQVSPLRRQKAPPPVEMTEYG